MPHGHRNDASPIILDHIDPPPRYRYHTALIAAEGSGGERVEERARKATLKTLSRQLETSVSKKYAGLSVIN